MKRLLLATGSSVLVLFSASSALAEAQGLIAVKSSHSVAQTIDRLEANAKQRGLKVFARIDHAAGASSIGKQLRPTELLIFGNPQGGTPFMQCAQTVAIDLPLKSLAWQDEQGQVWLGYDDPNYIAKRHGAADCAAVAPIGKALSALVAETVAP